MTQMRDNQTTPISRFPNGNPTIYLNGGTIQCKMYFIFLGWATCYDKPLPVEYNFAYDQSRLSKDVLHQTCSEQ